MDYNVLSEKLSSGHSVYIYDDFNEAVVRLIPDDNSVKVYIKHKGRIEKEVSISNSSVFEIILSGEKIDREMYDKF